MTKQYDIVSIVGNDSFTYQLYADISVPVEGTSEVSSELITDSQLDVMSAPLVVGSITPGVAFTYIRNSTVSNTTPYSIYLLCGDSYVLTFEDGSPSISRVVGEYKTILFYGYNTGGFFFRCPSPEHYSLIELDLTDGLVYRIIQNQVNYKCLKSDVEILSIPYTSLNYGSNTSNTNDVFGNLAFGAATFETFP